MLLRFSFLYFLGRNVALWLFSMKSRPRPGQAVGSRTCFAVVQVWIRENTLIWCRVKGVSQQVGLGVGPHRGTSGAVRRGAAGVWHNNVVPRAERGGRKWLRATWLFFGPSRGYDDGAARCDCLHSALEGFEYPITFLLLFPLTRLHFLELLSVISPHLLPCICQPPDFWKETSDHTLGAFQGHNYSTSVDEHHYWAVLILSEFTQIVFQHL